MKALLRRKALGVFLTFASLLLVWSWTSRSAAIQVQASAPAQAAILVDATRPGPVISPDLWGTNLTQQANAQQTVENPDFITSTRSLHIQLIRWPGGNNADAYDWKRDEEIRPGHRRQRTNGVDLARILRFVQDVGAGLTVTVNFGTMTAQDAADLVEFLNGPADSPWGAQRAAIGFPEPVRVRTFEVGNEIGQPHMWYYSWMAEDPVRYFFGGHALRQGFYNNAGSQAYDPVGAKGDFFKAVGGPHQTYTLRFPPVRQVRMAWFVDQDAAESCMTTYRQTGTLPIIPGQCQPWEQVDDLSSQPGDALVFILDASRGVIRFGDGIHGFAPLQGSYFLVEYETYGHEGFLDYARAMRAAPSVVPIRIGAAMLPFQDAQPIADDATMREIFQAMDFYVRHQYDSGLPRPAWNDYNARRQIPLDRIDTLAGVYGRVADYIQSLGLGHVPEIGVSEWNIFLNQDYWQINRTLEGAVLTASWFIHVLNQANRAPVAFAEQFALGGGNLALIRSQTNNSIAPMGYVFQGFGQWPHSRLLPVQVTGPGATAFNREVPYIAAAAALSPDGRTLRLALVNNARDETIIVGWQTLGFVPRAARAWQLTGPSFEAHNDRNPETIIPQPTNIEPPFNTITLPPHTVAFIELDAAIPRLHFPLILQK